MAASRNSERSRHSGAGLLLTQHGFSLAEMLITLAIFSIIMAGVFSAFTSQIKATSREYKVAESEIEFSVVKNILERDIQVAGYGLADDYGTLAGSPTNFNPKAFQAANGGPDQLRMMGTAMGLESRQAQGWTYIRTVGPPNTLSFVNWNDSREVVNTGDRVILMEPSSKRLLTKTVDSTEYWLFRYNTPANRMTTAHPDSGNAEFDTASVGNLIYGLYGSSSSDDDASTFPYYTVRYYFSDSRPSGCAPSTRNLLRAEGRNSDTPNGGDAVLSCVLDFQVAFGLDTDQNGTIDRWDNGGEDFTNGYTRENQRRRLKQVRVYLLVQSGRRDPDYTYPLDRIRVGETFTVGGTTVQTGREVVFTGDQRNYRWKLITLNVTPRNLI